MTKAVLFDLDDTLFDHRYAARCVLEDWQARHACLQAYSLQFLEQEDFRLLGEKHTLVMAGTLHPDESRLQRIQSLFACCGEEISREYAQELALERQSIYRNSRRAVPGAIPLLETLKGYARIGIVTNNFTEEQRDKMNDCGMAGLVDVLVTSEEVQQSKPAPRIFHVALERLGASASEAVMVGDSWQVDVIGARNAGIRPVWFNRDGLPKPDDHDVLEISSLEPAAVVARRIISPAAFAPDPQ